MTHVSPTRDALERSRVDLIELRRAGIPPRQYVPGAHGLIPKAKRLHIAAERKTGKSLVFGVVVALDIVAAGGTVVILDRENGADEYARRLNDVLTARGANAELEAAVRERYHYHAFPQLKIAWGSDDAYAHAFNGADLVVFDSSRTFLTSVGLKEDLADDFATFVEALVDPIARSGGATAILDNVGHDEKGRARGSSAKADLADIVFTMAALTAFNPSTSGRLQLTCQASRLGEIHGTWEMNLGGGTFGSWERPGGCPPDARTDVLDAAVRALHEAYPKPSARTGSPRRSGPCQTRPPSQTERSAKRCRRGPQTPPQECSRDPPARASQPMA